MAREPLFDSAFLRKLDRLALLTRRTLAGDMQGDRRSPRRGSSVEFADFRPYTHGDDIRQIDWNLYARLERFFLKLFVAEEELTVHLLVDTSASMDWGNPNKLDYARRLAGAFGYIALSGLDRVKVTALGAGRAHPSPTPQDSAEEQVAPPPTTDSAPNGLQTMPAVRGRRGAVPLFTFLQQLAPGGASDLYTTCHRYVQMNRNAGPLLLCSDLFDPRWKEALKALTSRPFEVVVLHTLAPQERDPQIDGDFRLVDSEGGPAVEITADLDLLRRYRQNLERWQQEIETFCRGRGMSYLPVDTAVPLEEFIFTHARQRGVFRS